MTEQNNASCIPIRSLSPLQTFRHGFLFVLMSCLKNNHTYVQIVCVYKCYLIFWKCCTGWTGMQTPLSHTFIHWAWVVWSACVSPIHLQDSGSREQMLAATIVTVISVKGKLPLLVEIGSVAKKWLSHLLLKKWSPHTKHQAKNRLRIIINLNAVTFVYMSKNQGAAGNKHGSFHKNSVVTRWWWEILYHL